MITTSFYRVIKMSFESVRRNVWLAIVATTVLALTLITISILGALQLLSNTAIQSVEQKVDLSVYLKTSAKPDDIERVERAIRSYAGVREVSYISQDEALKSFREKHKDNDLILKSLTELDQNPLQASFVVVAEKPEMYKDIAAGLSQDEFKDAIQNVNYKDNKDVIEKLTRATDIVRKTGFALSGVFIVISILVSFNTVRLAIYTRKEEVEIMRLVGATNWFIRWPFVFEGMLYALFATIINIAILYPTLIFLGPKISGLFPDSNLDLLLYFKQNLPLLLAAQFLIALVIGIISSFIAIRRYLKV